MAQYTPNVPQANQQINNTQQPIEDNFQYIYDLLAVNHVPFNTVDTFGKHNFVTYVQRSADPITNATEMALYSKMVNGDENQIELFYRYPNNGSIVQLTGANAGSSSGGSSVNLSSNGGSWGAGTNPSGYRYNAGNWQYTSSGILMLFGTANMPTNPTNVEFPVLSGIPTFNSSVFNIQLQLTQSYPQLTSGSNPSLAVNWSGITSFNMNVASSFSNTNSVINWIAIGI